MNSPVILILVTVKNRAEANRIARVLLTARLAACINIVGGVSSVFRWNGKIERSREELLVIKTTKRMFEDAAAAVKGAHSYENPEIIAVSLAAGRKAYMDWVRASVRQE